MAFQWIVLVTLFALTFARPDGKTTHEHSDHEESYKKPYGTYGSSEEDSYEFSYQVKAEDKKGKELDFGHEEKKAEGKVEGHYYVLLPDTRKQTVAYYVEGDSGYVAKVTYEGSAEYDKHHGYGKSKEHSEEKSKEYY